MSRCRFMASFVDLSMDVVLRDRLAIVHFCRAGGLCADIANVNVSHERVSEAAMLRMLLARLRPAQKCLSIALGDVIEAAVEEGRLHLPSGQLPFPLARGDCATALR